MPADVLGSCELIDWRIQEHVTTCLQFLEASNTVEILRAAGPEGMHVDDIAHRIGELSEGSGKDASARVDASKLSTQSADPYLSAPQGTDRFPVVRSHTAVARDVPLAAGGAAGCVRQQPFVGAGGLWEDPGRPPRSVCPSSSTRPGDHAR